MLTFGENREKPIFSHTLPKNRFFAIFAKIKHFRVYIGVIILGEASQILTQFSRNISSYEGRRELHMGCKMFAMSTFIYDL